MGTLTFTNEEGMKKAYSIRWQLTGVCILLVAVPVLTLGMLSANSSVGEINKLIENQVRAEVKLLAKNISDDVAANRQRVESAMKIVHDMLYAAGQPSLDSDDQMEIPAVNQVTQATISVRAPFLKIGDARIAGSYDIVDRIQKLVGGTATIFQMIPGGALRISTNVLNSDGSRAVNTFIPEDSPVYQKVAQGETFTGRAFVVNSWYQTAYEPIIDRAGRVIGMLYVGIADTSKAMLDELSKIVVGKTGYIFILDEKGDYVLSHNRQRDGERT
jgi:methyl-accepting chemotaxis protein